MSWCYLIYIWIKWIYAFCLSLYGQDSFRHHCNVDTCSKICYLFSLFDYWQTQHIALKFALSSSYQHNISVEMIASFVIKPQLNNSSGLHWKQIHTIKLKWHNIKKGTCHFLNQCWLHSYIAKGISLQWRHNGRDSVSNRQPCDCLLNRLFRPRSKKTSKLRVTGFCAENSPVTDEFPAQSDSNAENVSIWWRHHVMNIFSRHCSCWWPSTASVGIRWPSSYAVHKGP